MCGWRRGNRWHGIVYVIVLDEVYIFMMMGRINLTTCYHRLLMF
jgi:hypothetical protein